MLEIGLSDSKTRKTNTEGQIYGWNNRLVGLGGQA